MTSLAIMASTGGVGAITSLILLICNASSFVSPLKKVYSAVM
jgi:hypothetical protein